MMMFHIDKKFLHIDLILLHLLHSNACIYSGCGDNNECDARGRCVHYEGEYPDGMWVCGAPSDESEEEKTMLRGEIAIEEE